MRQTKFEGKNFCKSHSSPALTVFVFPFLSFSLSLSLSLSLFLCDCFYFLLLFFICCRRKKLPYKIPFGGQPQREHERERDRERERERERERMSKSKVDEYYLREWSKCQYVTLNTKFVIAISMQFSSCEFRARLLLVFISLCVDLSNATSYFICFGFLPCPHVVKLLTFSLFFFLYNKGKLPQKPTAHQITLSLKSL